MLKLSYEKTIEKSQSSEGNPKTVKEEQEEEEDEGKLKGDHRVFSLVLPVAAETPGFPLEWPFNGAATNKAMLSPSPRREGPLASKWIWNPLLGDLSPPSSPRT